MAQYARYNIIVMVYFKQKTGTCKSNPIVCAIKSRIETHISGFGGIDCCLYLFCAIYGKINEDVHITIINQFQPEGCPWKFLLQLHSLDVCVALKKEPGILCRIVENKK